jgi:hypothetical protein
MAVMTLFNRTVSSQQAMREGLEKVMKILKAREGVRTDLKVIVK